MNIRIVAAAGIVFAVLFISLGVARILPWEASGTLTATTIGVVSIIIAVERTEAKEKEICISQQPKLEGQGELVGEESILVGKEGCSWYSFAVEEKEIVTGEISSENYFNVYFLSPRNFAKYENGEDFKYEYGTEHASKMKVNFVPNKAGRFYIIIESASHADIDVDVSLHVRKSS